jgi:hypothetical protein
LFLIVLRNRFSVQRFSKEESSQVLLFGINNLRRTTSPSSGEGRLAREQWGTLPAGCSRARLRRYTSDLARE